jgi:tRNA(fMet)-specific endonuclease VapC
MLDTSICVELLRKQSTRAIERYWKCPGGSVVISIITLAELEFGAEASQHPAKNWGAVQQFCLGVDILPFDRDAAAIYGRLRATLKRTSQTIGPMDLLIAAHALAKEAILVTNNEREFLRVPGLAIENWL